MTIEPLSPSGAELDAIRVAYALAVLLAIDGYRVLPPRGDRSAPVGLARFVDLLPLARPRWWVRVAQLAVLAVAVDVATGWALLFLAVYLVVQITVRSSDGSVNHGDHLVCTATIALALGLGLWNAAERWGWDLGSWVAGSRSATATWWAAQAIVAVYFTSGLTKVLATAGTWLRRSPALLLSAAGRIEMQLAAGRRPSPVTSRLIEGLLPHPQLTRVLFGAGLLVELAAPVGLLGEVPLAVVGVGLVALHEANRWMLDLPFRSYQLLVLGFLIVPASPWP